MGYNGATELVVVGVDGERYGEEAIGGDDGGKELLIMWLGVDDDGV